MPAIELTEFFFTDPDGFDPQAVWPDYFTAREVFVPPNFDQPGDGQDWKDAKKQAGGWCGTKFKDNMRSGGNFISSSVLAMDFDAKVVDGVLHHPDPERTIAFWKNLGYEFVAQNSASHTPETPRFRLVLLLEEPITDWRQARILVDGFRAIDPWACPVNRTEEKDRARFYYHWTITEGNKEHAINVYSPGRRLEVPSLEQAAAYADEEERKYTYEGPLVWPPAPLADEEAIAMMERDTICLAMAKIPDTMRHDHAIRVGRSLGGYVAARRIDFKKTLDAFIQAQLQAGRPSRLAAHDAWTSMRYGARTPKRTVDGLEEAISSAVAEMEAAKLKAVDKALSPAERELAKIKASSLKAEVKNMKTDLIKTKKMTAKAESHAITAKRLAGQGVPKELIDELDMTADGAIISRADNICSILQLDPTLGGKLHQNDPQRGFRYNQLTEAEELNGQEIGNSFDAQVVTHLGKVYKMKVAESDVRTAVKALCNSENGAYNPAREFFEDLTWDGQDRVMEMMTRGFRCAVDNRDARANPVYVALVARIFLVSVAARAISVETEKVDTCWIHNGPQGMKKTTAFQTLVGKRLFASGSIKPGNKDDMFRLKRALVWELGETGGVFDRTVESVKQMLSAESDWLRRPYDKSPTNVKRTTVLVMTTNNDRVLYDANNEHRRWLPTVHIESHLRHGETQGDLEWLEANRDQIWAQAVHMYKTGVKWYADTREERDLCQAAAERAAVVTRADEVASQMLRTGKLLPFSRGEGDKGGMLLGDILQMMSMPDDEGSRRKMASALRKVGFKEHLIAPNTAEHWFAPEGYVAPNSLPGFVKSTPFQAAQAPKGDVVDFPKTANSKE